MPTHRLVARCDAEQPGRFLVRSPAVGVLDGVPAIGVYLNPMEGLFTLSVLNRRYVVQLPRGVQGRVVEQLVEDTQTAVAYNQPLLRLSQVEERPTEEQQGSHRAAASHESDLIPVPAPSEGVFYRRPTPES